MKTSKRTNNEDCLHEDRYKCTDKEDSSSEEITKRTYKRHRQRRSWYHVGDDQLEDAQRQKNCNAYTRNMLQRKTLQILPHFPPL